jgi:hypothetical protein
MMLESKKFQAFLFRVAFLMLIIPTISFLGPMLETKFLPVSVDVKIYRIEPVMREGREWSKFWVTSNKIRQCRVMAVGWFREQMGRKYPVQIDYSLARNGGGNNTRTRPLGVFYSGPYIIDIPPDRLKEEGVARVEYECHILWVTYDNYYPEQDFIDDR